MASDLMTDRQMESLSRDNQCVQAITHTLTAIRDAPTVWNVGPGSPSWALLTEALATLTGRSLSDVRRAMMPAVLVAVSTPPPT